MPQLKTRTARYDAEMLGQRNNEELWQLRWHWGDSDDGPYRIPRGRSRMPGVRSARMLSPEDIAKGIGVLEAKSSSEAGSDDGPLHGAPCLLLRECLSDA